MIVREIMFGSDAYREECALRQRVLRAPLGLNLHDENLEAERGQLHFGLFDEHGKLLASVTVVPLSTTQAKLRQMAVAPEQQRRGCGRMLLRSVETSLRQRGLTRLSLHARKTAAGFYAGLGYTACGEEFTEVGIPHVEMLKVFEAC